VGGHSRERVSLPWLLSEDENSRTPADFSLSFWSESVETRKNEYLTKDRGIDVTDLYQSIFIPPGAGHSAVLQKTLGVCILPRGKWYDNVRGGDMNSACLFSHCLHYGDHLRNSDT